MNNILEWFVTGVDDDDAKRQCGVHAGRDDHGRRRMTRLTYVRTRTWSACCTGGAGATAAAESWQMCSGATL